MQIRLFTLKFNPIDHGFSDKEIRDFLCDKKVISIRDHFFTVNQEPFITFIITYEQGDMTQPKVKENREARDASWKALLKEEHQPLFNQLREWRSERCKKDGVPPYVVCNNKQLAKMAVKRPQTKEQLSELDGFGPGKMKKYSEEILNITRIKREEDES